MIKKYLLLVLLLFCSFVYTQNPNLSNNSSVSVLTCGRGEQLYSTFGHTAIRVKDTENQLDVVYNYGAFDFNTEHFYLKFVKGDLQYFVTATSFEDFILEYQYDQREVIEQVLDLTLLEKQSLFESLNKTLYSSDRYYTYKFIDRNCTTMVADKISATLHNQPINKVAKNSLSYRKLLYPYFDNFFDYKLGINIIFGLKTDFQATQLFLPSELLESLDKISYNGKPLVLSKTTLLEGSNHNTPSFSFFKSIYFVIVLLLLLLLLNKHILFSIYLTSCGLLGLFLCLVGIYSQHEEVLWNYNALLFNPLYLLLPLVSQNAKQKIRLIILIMIGAYSILMVTKPHLFIVLPFIITNGYIIAKDWKEKKLLSSVE
jgi:hypothetical protein